MMLPVAPATDFIASTSGTPAPNIVASVRAKRAIAALRRIGPITGMPSDILSIHWRIGRDRL